MSTKKNNTHIQRRTRNIEAWATADVCVEREGSTITAQVRLPNGGAAGLVLTVQQAVTLLSMLRDATATPGNVVTDMVKKDDAFVSEESPNQ